MLPETELAQRLKRHDPSWTSFLPEPGPMTPAAVLLPLFYKAGEAHILLTMRTDQVSHHKGQISFPGGKSEPADQSLAETALRESWEEVGLRREDVRLIGQMKPMPTLTRFWVHPFVGLIPYPYAFEVNPGEIATLIEVPLSHLRQPQNRRQGKRSFAGREYEIYYFDYQEFTIWGITGHLLHDFLTLLD
jgi:8-oxo-dGTP pyrophosphatase MutT (NUDIX family)